MNILPLEIAASVAQKAKGKCVVLPEIEDERVKRAADVLQNRYGVKVLLPKLSEIQTCKETTLQRLLDIAEKKGKDLARVSKASSEDPLYYAGVLLETGAADAVVAGATVATGEVIRAALATVGVNTTVPLVSSAFLMALQQPTAGGASLVVFADCGVNPQPNSLQLSYIAQQAAHAYLQWMGGEPKISFLSFSTKGSASHADVGKVREACEIFSQRNPTFLCEGEVQFDAAVVPEIALRKNPHSKIAGATNVFVFPDLDAGNIGYKIAQRLAGAQAFGPVLLGAAKPFSDLSRGATVEDIVGVALLTLALCE